MNKEELEKEAKERAEKLEESQTLGVYDNDEDLKYDESYNEGQVAGYEEGYLAGAEPREKRIAELEAQIEKMKTRIKEIIFSNDFVNTSPYQNLNNKVSALCDFYKEIKENDKRRT